MATNHGYALHRLFGDSDGDGDVDATDEAAFNAALGKRAGQVGYLAYFDINASGTIDAKDRDQFRKRLGIDLLP
jgi:hypothetical protein